MILVVVTGTSGSGKSIALHTLEDLGYYCIDNLPVFLLEEFGRRLIDRPEPGFERTAVGIDVRSSPSGLERLSGLVQELRTRGIECRILFLDAETDVLIRRFSETRRKHPLADDHHPLQEAIKLERQLLEPIRSCADLHLDTTHTTLHQLRDQIRERVGQTTGGMSIQIRSFGFKHGVPRDADFVFDVRCLPNPHWQPALRPLTGRDAAVREFLEASPGVRQMFEDIAALLQRWIPAFESDGRSYLTIAVGCTGGQHRSVYMAEQLGRHLSRDRQTVQVRHRELS